MSEQEPRYQTRESINGATSGVRPPAPLRWDGVAGPPGPSGYARWLGNMLAEVQAEAARASRGHGCGSPELEAAIRRTITGPPVATPPPADATQRVTPRDYAPFEPGRRFVPEYYRPRRRNSRIASDADPSDIGDAFALRPLRSIAIKYLVRAGYKPGQSAAKDLTKALEVIQRELEYLEVGGEDALDRPAWDDVSGHEVSR